MNQEITVASLKDRLNENINDVEAAALLGNYFFDQDEPAQAIVYYRHALDIDPSMVGVRTDLGTMYWRNENVSLAEKAFRDVISAQPDFGNAYINLGLLMQLVKSDVSGARQIWQKLVDTYPSHEACAKARELLQKTTVIARY